MIYPENFEQKTGFDKIKISIKNKCVTQSASGMVDEVRFLTDREAIVQLLLRTSEMKTICMLDNSFPADGYVDACKFLPKIKNAGNFLETSELLDLKTAVNTVRQIFLFFNGEKQKASYPVLAELVKPVSLMPEVVKEIDRVVDRFGKIKDDASENLYSIRKEIAAKNSIVNRRVQEIFKQAKNEGIVDLQSGVSIRNGRVVIPVLAVHKRKIKGLVIGESASGKTIFIEPMEIVELNNQITELRFDEQREIIKILVELTGFLHPYYDDILFLCKLLVEIDFIRAKANYAVETEAGMPIINDEPQIDLRKARHPILMKILSKEKKEIVPLNICLNQKQRILLISGPNAGGKSVCLKTVGLLQYMLQCGLLIPASEVSETGIFKNIFIDIGDAQSIENDLSTYSSHLTDMKFFMKNADDNTLVLIDEFGAGTEPEAGGAIAEAVLADILKKKAFGVITTHYANLKYFASSSSGIINGAMLFDVQKFRPLFKLETGIHGNSFAFEIARKIGIPPEIVKEAEAKLSQNHVKLEKNFREIARDKRYWEEKRENIRKTNRHLEELSEKYEKKLLEIKDLKQKLIEDAKAEAKKMLSSVNREIENTIRKIKESQADKELTKIARNKLEGLGNQIIESKTTDDKIEREIQKIKEKFNRKENSDLNTEQSVLHNLNFQIGDKVKIENQTAVGEIISVGNSNVAVAMGNIIMNVSPDRLVKISQSEYKSSLKNSRNTHLPVSSDLSVKRLNFKPFLDVRGQRTVEALEQVTCFIDEAIILEMNEIRILHGKGNGILKEEIRNYLRTFGSIMQFADESEESGGAGITVVRFV